MISRRNLVAGAAGLAAGVGVMASHSALGGTKKDNQPTTSPDKRGRRYTGKIIDFRARPPFRGFRTAFHAGKDADKSDEELMERFLHDMDTAGIGLAVAMGRTVGQPNARARDIFGGNVPNDDVEALVNRYPDRFVGFGSVDISDVKRAIQQVDDCVERGLAGIAFYNPAQTPPRHYDDAALFPIYERCARHGAIVSMTSSMMVGPDMSYSMPIHIQRVALEFPQLRIVVPHGAWPWTTQIIGVVLQGVLFGSSQVYLIPDFYFSQEGLPGRQDYIDMADDPGGFGLNQRIMYASSYPALPLVKSVEVLQRTPFKNPDAPRLVFHDNAARLLGI